VRILADELILFTAATSPAEHPERCRVCGCRLGPDAVQVRGVTAALPPGVDAVVIHARTRKVLRVTLRPGFDPLTVAPFEHCLDTVATERLRVCPYELGTLASPAPPTAIHGGSGPGPRPVKVPSSVPLPTSAMSGTDAIPAPPWQNLRLISGEDAARLLRPP
jgi:hypothetical protein